MVINQLKSDFDRPNGSLDRSNASRLSILGILFFIMGAPNVYAALQRRADIAATYRGSGVPRYVWVVMLAIAIASILEFAIV
jgi:type IV pilus biogenesis protein CpaD/CtpE